MPLARCLSFFVAISCCVSAQDLSEDLLAAARKGDAAQVKALLDRGADVNSKSSYGSTALFFACDRGHMEVIKLLLDRGADINTEDTFYHFTPLIWAVEKDRSEVVRALLDHGAKSPALVLTSAAQNGNLAMAKIALDAAKGTIDKPTLSTSLAMAERAKKPEIVALLKEAGAEPLKTVELDPAVLNSYAGAYNGGRGGTEFELTLVVKEKGLSGTIPGMGVITFMPSDKTHFHAVEFPGMNLEFSSGDAFRMLQGGGIIDFKRKAAAK